MWFYFTALILFLLLAGYFFVFPLCKKRPVLIKRGALIVFLLSLLLALFPAFGIWTFPTGLVIAFIIYLLNPWLIYGITNSMIYDALEKAALATRTPIEKLDNMCRIDNRMEVRLFNPVGKISIIFFRKTGNSKKAKLILTVFKKFIQNYFI